MSARPSFSSGTRSATAWGMGVLFFAIGSAARGAGLPLSAVVLEAVEKSPEVERVRFSAARAGLEEPFVLANLDPHVEALYNQRQDRAPRAAPVFQGEFARNEILSVGIRQNTLIGTEMRLQASQERLENPASFRLTDPTVESRLSLDVRQALLKNLWGRPDKAIRAQARAGVRAAQAAVRSAVEETALTAVRAYADLYAAREAVSVTEEGVRSAQRLVDVYGEKKRYGLVETSDLAQAQSLLEVQRAELLLAQSAQERAEIALAALLFRAREGFTQGFPVVRPEFSTPMPDSLAAALERGLSRRPDMAGVQARLDAARAGERLAKLNSLPELAFVGSLGYAGLDGTGAPSWQDMTELDHPIVSAGLTLNVPILFRKEKLDKEEGRLRTEDARSDVRRVERDAAREIRDAWENWRFQVERRAARQRIVAIEKQKFDAETERFRQGRSSTDLLVRFQQDLVRARLLDLRSDMDEVLSRVALIRASGDLTEVLNLP